MLQFGCYEKEITPPLGVDIPGYYLNRYAEDVKDRIYAKAFVFSDGSEDLSRCAAMVIVDAVELHPENCNAIIKRASEYTGIPVNNISVAATHTHMGIPCGDVISHADEGFMEVFCRLAADCITLAFRRMVPCKVSCGVGDGTGMSCVRDYLMKDGNVVTNPKKDWICDIVDHNGKPDTDIPALSVYDGSGKPIACLYSFACHQDCVGGKSFSADYSGVVSRRMKERYGEDFVSIYFAGASGDINHLDRIHQTALDYQKTGENMAKELMALTDAPKIMSDAFGTVKESILIRRRVASEEEKARARWVAENRKARRDKYDMTGQNANLLLAYEEAFADKPLEMEIPLHVIRVGEAKIFALPGELYSVFGNALKDSCPNKLGLVCELSNMDAGYIPPKELFGTAAYPVQLCHGSYLEEEAGEKMVKKAIELSQTL